jgi:hypothetical protein
MKKNLPNNPVPDDSPLMVAPVISTCHLSRWTMSDIADSSGFMGHLRHGTIFYIPHYEERTGGQPFPDAEEPDLEVVYAFMARRGYRFVRLDSDGDEIEGLPVYDWE